MKHNLKKLDKSQVEIEFELSSEEFSVFLDKALDHLKGHVKMDGFRPGSVPKEMVEKKINQEDLLMEAGELAVKDSYTQFVKENNIEPIGQPEVQIKKIAKGSELLFTIKVSVLPEVVLPDYKEIARKVEGKEVVVDEKEIEESINYLQRARATFTDKPVAETKDYVKIEYQNDSINGGKVIKDMFILGEGGFLKDFEDNLLGMKVGDEKDFVAKFPENAPDGLGGKEGKFHVKMLAVQKMELPEVNDEFAKTLGGFDTVAILKENIKEGVGMEKQEAERQRKRKEIITGIAKKMSVELPEAMVAYEQNRLLEALKNQVTQRFKITLEEYLTSVKKTEEELQQSYRKEAEDRIREYMILREIGKREGVEVLPEEVAEEAKKLEQYYQGQGSSKVDSARIKEYAKDTLYNEKVFQFLENFSK